MRLHESLPALLPGLLVCGATLLAAAPPARAQAFSVGQDATPQEIARRRISTAAEQLEAWLPEVDPEQTLSLGRRRWLAERVETLTSSLDWVPSELVPVADVLLELASLRIASLPSPSFFLGGGTTYRIRKAGLDALTLIEAAGHRAELIDWLARGVLAEPAHNAVSRRWLALFLLLPQESALVDGILVRIARDPEDPLSGEVLSALASRPGPQVDAFLVGLLDRPRILGMPHPHNLIRQRLEQGPLDPTAAGALVQHVKRLLLDDDWRVASRGIELCRSLDPMRVAPMLVEALYTWQNRGERKLGNSRRTTWEIVRALRRLSGRNIGDSPRSWTTWWKAVREGRVELSPGQPADDVHVESTAQFFGLQPISDRVTFIIDHSGSMISGWASSGATRYDQAIEQLLNFLLSSGEETRFNVILFSGTTLVSSPHLVPATAQNLELAQRSLAVRVPEGGTNLRGAVETALRLDAEGKADPARLETDTIVVLCDGETSTGPDWVRPLLDRVNDDLRVVFHCVQIGGAGDGTLEELARLTGGDFVRVNG